MKAVREVSAGGEDQAGHAAVDASARRLPQWRVWLADPAVRAALAATASLRLALSLVAALTMVLSHSQYVAVVSAINRDRHGLVGVYPAPLSGPAAYLVGPWLRWDADNYLNIALHGYSFAGSTAFMPLYPVLIRLVSFPLGGSVAASALLISTIATFVTLALLYRLVERLTGSATVATWSVVAVCLLPVSFFLMAPYTEALFCALSLAAMLAALDRRWGAALLWATLASLTRQQGLLLGLFAVPVVADRLEMLRKGGQPLPALVVAVGRNAWKPLAFALTPVAAYGIWVAVLTWGLHQGAPWQELSASSLWRQTFTWPGVGVVVDIGHVLLQPADVLAHYPDIVLDVVGSVAAAIGIGVAWRRLPPGMLLYLVGGWCMAVVKVQTLGVTTGAARYLLALLPLCLVPGEWLARAKPYVRLPVVAAAAVVVCTILSKWVLWTWIN